MNINIITISVGEETRGEETNQDRHSAGLVGGFGH